jgi:hypothetical protein
MSIRYSDWVRLKDAQQRQAFLYAAREAVVQQLSTRGAGGRSGSSSVHGGVVVTPHASWAGDGSCSSSGGSGAGNGVSTTTHILRRLWDFFMNT